VVTALLTNMLASHNILLGEFLGAKQKRPQSLFGFEAILESNQSVLKAAEESSQVTLKRVTLKVKKYSIGIFNFDRMTLPVGDRRHSAIAGQMDFELARNLVFLTHLEHLLDIRLGRKLVLDKRLLHETGKVAINSIVG